MEVSVKVHKIITFTIYDTVLLIQVKVLVRLLSTEQIIKNASSMCISLSIKSTDISEIMVEFAQYFQNYFQYVYVPI